MPLFLSEIPDNVATREIAEIWNAECQALVHMHGHDLAKSISKLVMVGAALVANRNEVIKLEKLSNKTFHFNESTSPYIRDSLGNLPPSPPVVDSIRMEMS